MQRCRCSGDAVRSCYFHRCRPQLSRNWAYPRSILSPLIKSGMYFFDRQYLRFNCHFVSMPNRADQKNELYQLCIAHFIHPCRKLTKRVLAPFVASTHLDLPFSSR
jgi:hypothetical protein